VARAGRLGAGAGLAAGYRTRVAAGLRGCGARGAGRGGAEAPGRVARSAGRPGVPRLSDPIARARRTPGLARALAAAPKVWWVARFPPAPGPPPPPGPAGARGALRAQSARPARQPRCPRPRPGEARQLRAEEEPLAPAASTRGAPASPRLHQERRRSRLCPARVLVVVVVGGGVAFKICLFF
jgi:hypothetical protein